MLYGLVLVIHVIVSLVLIGVILLQGGRGGLSEALGGAAAQSLFGGAAATVLTRITTACAALFVVTCVSLAYLSTVKGRSVIERVPLMNPESLLPMSSPQPKSSAKPSSASAPAPAASEPSSAHATQTGNAKPVSPQRGPAESQTKTTTPSEPGPSR